jgi:hypothetical protein
MKGHTGGVMSLGKGGVYGTSTRQKLVTKSSTEAELVGVSDRAMMFVTPWCIRITKVQYYLRRMAGHPAVKGPDILIYDTFSSLTGLPGRKSA